MRTVTSLIFLLPLLCSLAESQDFGKVFKGLAEGLFKLNRTIDTPRNRHAVRLATGITNKLSSLINKAYRDPPSSFSRYKSEPISPVDYAKRRAPSRSYGSSSSDESHDSNYYNNPEHTTDHKYKDEYNDNTVVHDKRQLGGGGGFGQQGNNGYGGGGQNGFGGQNNGFNGQNGPPGLGGQGANGFGGQNNFGGAGGGFGGQNPSGPNGFPGASNGFGGQNNLGGGGFGGDQGFGGAQSNGFGAGPAGLPPPNPYGQGGGGYSPQAQNGLRFSPPPGYPAPTYGAIPSFGLAQTANPIYGGGLISGGVPGIPGLPPPYPSPFTSQGYGIPPPGYALPNPGYPPTFPQSGYASVLPQYNVGYHPAAHLGYGAIPGQNTAMLERELNQRAFNQRGSPMNSNGVSMRMSSNALYPGFTPQSTSFASDIGMTGPGPPNQYPLNSYLSTLHSPRVSPLQQISFGGYNPGGMGLAGLGHLAGFAGFPQHQTNPFGKHRTRRQGSTPVQQNWQKPEGPADIYRSSPYQKYSTRYETLKSQLDYHTNSDISEKRRTDQINTFYQPNNKSDKSKSEEEISGRISLVVPDPNINVSAVTDPGFGRPVGNIENTNQNPLDETKNWVKTEQFVPNLVSNRKAAASIYARPPTTSRINSLSRKAHEKGATNSIEDQDSRLSSESLKNINQNLVNNDIPVPFSAWEKEKGLSKTLSANPFLNNNVQAQGQNHNLEIREPFPFIQDLPQDFITPRTQPPMSTTTPVPLRIHSTLFTRQPIKMHVPPPVNGPTPVPITLFVAPPRQKVEEVKRKIQLEYIPPVKSNRIKIDTASSEHSERSTSAVLPNFYKHTSESAPIDKECACLDVDLRKFLGPWIQIYGNPWSLGPVSSEFGQHHLTNSSAKIKPACVGLHLGKMRGSNDARSQSRLRWFFRDGVNNKQLHQEFGLIKTLSSKKLDFILPKFRRPICVVKTGGPRRALYSYLVLTETSGPNKCKALHVLARDAQKFFHDYNAEVVNYIREEVEANQVDPIGSVTSPELCELGALNKKYS